MGESAFVTPETPAVTSVRRNRKRVGSLDIPLLCALILLGLIGLVFVYSSSWEFSMIFYSSPYSMFWRQLLFFAAGIGIAVIISSIDYHKFRKLIVIGTFTVLIMLALVALGIGETRLGANRTLFGGSVQPSEFAKLATVFYLSLWLYSKRDKLNEFSFGLLPLAAIIGVMAGLIVLQPDISAAFTVVLLSCILFYIAGGEIRQIVLITVIAIITAWIAVSVYPSGRARLSGYIAGIQNPQQATDQVIRSIEAIVHGGFFGVGIGQSSVKFTGLPVAPLDSIFAVIAEESGIFGSLIIIVLYVIILWRGLFIAENAPDLFGKLLAAGVSVWIFIEAMVNMLAMVNMMPFAGNALPLISAGGSSLLSAMVGIGILFSVNRTSEKLKEYKEGSVNNAVVDLRRGDRRGRVPRTVRPGRAR
jgi:cell division protein FtsW